MAFLLFNSTLNPVSEAGFIRNQDKYLQADSLRINLCLPPIH